MPLYTQDRSDRPQPDARLLVVDDQAFFRETIAEMFDGEAGLRVSQAASLAEARAILDGVDIAIVDLGLPDGSGAELIHELHAVNPDATVVVFSASVDDVIASTAVNDGAAAALNKLDGFRALMMTVKRLRPSTVSASV